MKRLFLGALCMGILIACGMLETEKKGAKATQIDSELAGSWSSSCISNDALDLTHTNRTINFSNIGDFDKTEKFYNNDRCDDPGFTYQVVGTYSAMGQNEANKSIKNINYTVTEANVTVNSQTAVELLNGATLCGIKKWKVGEKTDITGKQCSGFSLNKGDVIFDVYKVEGNSLSFGNKFFFLSEDDADSRPENITTEVTFTKK